VRVVRIFNTYGPRMAIGDGRVVSSFIVQALRGEQMTVYGDGLQTRSFCFVDDLVRALVAAMESPHDLVGPVNLGNPAEFSIRELADLVSAATGSSVSVVNLPRPADDPRQRRPDISQARALLGWTPEIPLEQGLQRTVEYFRAVLETERSVAAPSS
ncbi:MAG: GDP-mannose 4,6-dehydratase, partial [Deinococcales bacterium]